LSTTFFMSCGDEELALLDVDRPAGRAPPRWMKSVWRHRKAGVCSTSTTAATSGDLGLVVHVGEHGHAELAPAPRPGSRRPALACPGRGTTCRELRLALS
jgi:hypothetical protein